MDKTQLFQFLSTQAASSLLDLLSTAYDQMNIDQRRWVFGKLVDELLSGLFSIAHGSATSQPT